MADLTDYPGDGEYLDLPELDPLYVPADGPELGTGLGPAPLATDHAHPIDGDQVLLTESSVSPYGIVDSMVATGAYKASRPRHMIVVRAILSSFTFGAVTTFVGTVVTQTGQAWLGALIFPTALVIVILLGLELARQNQDHAGENYQAG